MRILVGTSGWSYKGWKGTFYPSDLKSDDMLHYYATKFPTVEINSSFYRMPTEKVLLQWATQVPADFRFVLKASRRITHINGLMDTESLAHFLQTANILGERLGPTLFQCPPSLRKDIARLGNFLAHVPKTWRAAMEFRHSSWFDDDVYAILRAHDIPLVTTEDDDTTAQLVPTASWGYLRLRRTDYAESELATWVQQIKHQAWEEAFVFFKHDEDGSRGPTAAMNLLAQA